MRILITGASGFVGGHLIRHLLKMSPEVEIHGTTLTNPTQPTPDRVQFHSVQLRDPQQVVHLIETIQPDYIYHLAAQAFVPRSFEAPWETLENNVRSQLNLFQACINLNLRPRMLIVGSADIYGIVTPDQIPITEEARLCPTSPYSVSKITQDMLALQYHYSHDLQVMRARPFNHVGPGQSEAFVVPAFTSQIIRIEAGHQPPVLSVGDLSAKRDFTDVRDIVRAYRLIMEKGTPGDVYNVASGRAVSIRYVLDCLLEKATVPIEVQVDPARLRPTKIPILLGDHSRLTKQTGWKPEIPFEQTLNDVLKDHRERHHNRLSK